ncbi:hypothetical protein [Salibaculum griseiflavum]|uniref:Ferrochelatase n=1 Tax=Salibaculum griseiflavum TaxID=1914409 RepID=A0A2V1P1Y8_9RHOB|nr:hypothetical protein [Salibaculum griseiflavum]PWG15728.1 hypothetical protein DFK10_15515 [Salibaculum griseiflavum]
MTYAKHVAAAAMIGAMTATSAAAGGMAPAIEMEPVEIVEETGGSSSNLLIPLILIALIAAAASSTSGNAEPE